MTSPNYRPLQSIETQNREAGWVAPKDDSDPWGAQVGPVLTTKVI